MRVNVYAEEMTDRVELIEKVIDGHAFTAIRFYLELPVTVGGTGEHRSQEGSPRVFAPISGAPAQVAGPFIHHPGDDDSSAVTFWGKQDLRPMLKKALALLDAHYVGAPATAHDAALRQRGLCGVEVAKIDGTMRFCDLDAGHDAHVVRFFGR